MAATADRVDLVGPAAARNLARAALPAALTGAFAHVSFPNSLSPGVPVTLQVLGGFVVAAGLFAFALFDVFHVPL